MALPDLGDIAAVRAWRRAVHDTWGEGTVGGEIEHVPGEVAGVEVLEVGDPAPPRLLYLHGGGYVLGSAGVAAPITARLALGLRVTSVEYRLAPEHPFPAALDDAWTVYRTIAAASPAPLAVAGDSAGGALAVGVALRALDEPDVPAPAALVLLCPHLAHTADGGPLAAAYRGEAAEDDPLLSPLHAPDEALAALPPTLLQAGADDALLDHAVRFARRCRLAGRPVELDVWAGMWHTWQYHRELPEADLALAEAVAFVQRHAAPAVGQTAR